MVWKVNLWLCKFNKSTLLRCFHIILSIRGVHWLHLKMANNGSFCDPGTNLSVSFRAVTWHNLECEMLSKDWMVTDHFTSTIASVSENKNHVGPNAWTYPDNRPLMAQQWATSGESIGPPEADTGGPLSFCPLGQYAGWNLAIASANQFAA